MIKKIQLELPVSWFENEQDGERHKKFYINFIQALSSFSIPISLINLPFGADSGERIVEKGTIVFSYHSYGFQKNVWHLKEAPIVPLYILDKHGYSGWSNFINEYEENNPNITLEDADLIIDEFRKNMNLNNISKYNQPGFTDLDIRDYIFFPLQVINDPVSIFNKFNLFDVIIYCAKLAEQTKTFLIFKLHPFSNSTVFFDFLKEISISNDFVKIYDANIYSLIGGSRAVITVNSGVGIEALIQGSSVYFLGKCEYSDIGFSVTELSDLDDLFLGNVEKMYFHKKAKLAYLLNNYWIDYNNIDAMVEKIYKCFMDFDPNYGVISKEEYFEVYACELLKYNSELGLMSRELDFFKKELDLLRNINKLLRDDSKGFLYRVKKYIKYFFRF